MSFNLVGAVDARRTRPDFMTSAPPHAIPRTPRAGLDGGTSLSFPTRSSLRSFIYFMDLGERLAGFVATLHPLCDVIDD